MVTNLIIIDGVVQTPEGNTGEATINWGSIAE